MWKRGPTHKWTHAILIVGIYKAVSILKATRPIMLIFIQYMNTESFPLWDDCNYIEKMTVTWTEGVLEGKGHGLDLGVRNIETLGTILWPMRLKEGHAVLTCKSGSCTSLALSETPHWRITS